jgi:hypothetical protein
MLWLLTFLTFAQAQTGISILEDPMVSFRCKELVKERNAKVTIKQRLTALIERTKKLIKKTPQHKKTVLSQLKGNKKKLETRRNDSIVRLKQMEEQIIRSGCPGINF